MRRQKDVLCLSSKRSSQAQCYGAAFAAGCIASCRWVHLVHIAWRISFDFSPSPSSIFPTRPSTSAYKMGNMPSAMNMDPPKVYRDLCGLRYDNKFRFASDQDRGITTTCFNDVVLEPLATWVLLLVLLPLLALTLRRKKAHSQSKSRLIHYRSSAYRNENKFSGRHSRWRTGLDVLYMLLVVAALLMSKYSRSTNLIEGTVS